MTRYAVAALYVQPRSVYADLARECYDERRDARTYTGALPVVAHPPCRAWGRYAHRAKARADERDLAFHALRMVRLFGGVLEHPASSAFWRAAGIRASHRDAFGFVMPVWQSWFGHRAPKATWLYVVGVEPRCLPPFELALGVPPGRVESMCRQERERTPHAFATWLCELASRCQS